MELPLLYEEEDEGEDSWKRVAAEGEKPSFGIGPGYHNSVHDSLYKQVIWSQEEAAKAYCSKEPTLDFVYVDKKVKRPMLYRKFTRPEKP